MEQQGRLRILHMMLEPVCFVVFPCGIACVPTANPGIEGVNPAILTLWKRLAMSAVCLGSEASVTCVSAGCC